MFSHPIRSLRQFSSFLSLDVTIKHINLKRMHDHRNDLCILRVVFAKDEYVFMLLFTKKNSN